MRNKFRQYKKANISLAGGISSFGGERLLEYLELYYAPLAYTLYAIGTIFVIGVIYFWFTERNKLTDEQKGYLKELEGNIIKIHEVEEDIFNEASQFTRNEYLERYEIPKIEMEKINDEYQAFLNSMAKCRVNPRVEELRNTNSRYTELLNIIRKLSIIISDVELGIVVDDYISHLQIGTSHKVQHNLLIKYGDHFETTNKSIDSITRINRDVKKYQWEVIKRISKLKGK